MFILLDTQSAPASSHLLYFICRFSFCSFCFVLEPYPAVLYGLPGMKPRSVACKGSFLLSILSLQPYSPSFLTDFKLISLLVLFIYYLCGRSHLAVLRTDSYLSVLGGHSW